MNFQPILLFLISIFLLLILICLYVISDSTLYIPKFLIDDDTALPKMRPHHMVKRGIVSMLLIISISFVVLYLVQSNDSRDSFTISENRSMLIILDNSPSMGVFFDKDNTLLDISKEFVSTVVEQSNTHPVELSIFSESFLTLSPMGINKAFFLEQLHNIEVAQGNDSTAITDALLFGISYMSQKKTPKRQIVIITDGLETKASSFDNNAKDQIKNARMNLDIFLLRVGDINSNIVYFEDQDGTIYKASKPSLTNALTEFETSMQELNVPIFTLNNQKDFSRLGSLISEPEENLTIIKESSSEPHSKKLFQVYALAFFLLYILVSEFLIGRRL